jgi:hypothetical protein
MLYEIPAPREREPGGHAMTQAEWMVSTTNPAGMLEYLQGQPKRMNPSGRKLRLIAVACAQRIWPLIRETDQKEFVEAISVAEQFADGEIAEADLLRKSQTAPPMNWEIRIAIHTCRPDAKHAAHGVVLSAAKYVRHRSNMDETAKRAESHDQSRLMRCLLGNPFRPVAFDAAWRTSTAVALARGMYESRDFGAMPILADALQDAGCDSDDILTHCRGDGPHCRGCWVVDLVLGKA